MSNNVGVTHDVVMYINDTQSIGLILRPSTYRVNMAPTFVPRFGVGDVRGADRTRWCAWLQSRFDGGSGVMHWSSSGPTNRFAESHLVDIGDIQPRRKHMLEISTNDLGSNFDRMDMNESLFGDISPSVLPIATTSESPGMMSKMFSVGSGGARRAVWNNDMFVFDMSETVHAWITYGLVLMTNFPDVWQKIMPLRKQLDITYGKWCTIHTTGVNMNIVSAVKFSGVIVSSVVANNTQFLMQYGPTSTTMTNSVIYYPQYSTRSDRLETYDNKLWRSVNGNISYLTPRTGTTSEWSSYLAVGDVSVPIRNMCKFNGRLYLGKSDSLWVFDAGVVYMVEDFSNEFDPYNFRVMFTFKGAMYFNVKSNLYRLTDISTIELVQEMMPDTTIMSGVGIGNEVYTLTARGNTSPEPSAWIFNPETGGSRKWWEYSEVCKKREIYMTPTELGTAMGYMWISPMYVTGDIGSLISVSDPGHKSYTDKMNFATSGSYLITSMLDFGTPDLLKVFDRVDVDYTLNSLKDRIVVSYLNNLRNTQYSIAAFAYHTQFDNKHYWDLNGPLNDGDLSTGVNLCYFNYTSPKRNWVGGRLINQLIFGLDAPYDQINLFIDLLGSLSHISTIKFWEKSTKTWVDVPGYTSYRASAADKRCSYNWSVSGPLTTWVADSASNLVFAGPGLADLSTFIHDRIDSDRYWIRFSIYDGDDDFNMADFLEVSTSYEKGASTPTFANERGNTLVSQDWNTLGTIGGYTDFHNSVKSLSFPSPLPTGRGIMLKFDFFSTDQTRPSVGRYTVRYMPAPSNLRTVDFTAIVSDGLQLLDMNTIENSAAHIGATLFSLAGSPIPYICALPWPNPVGWTSRFLVSISQPGAFVPELSYGNNVISADGAEIVIHLDEV